MRDKLNSGSFSDLPEHEQLEVILFSVIHRGNTNEIAHRLLDKYGSVYGVLAADIDSLTEVEGVGVRVAEFLHNLPSILGVVMRSKIEYESNNEMVLKDISSLKTFLFTLFTDTITERVYMLMLNKGFRLIKFEKVSDGSIDDVYIDVGKVVRRAILNNASYVVLAHNHPSGAAVPSGFDISATGEVAKGLEVVGIGFLDHVIISGDRYYRFRENRVL